MIITARRAWIAATAAALTIAGGTALPSPASASAAAPKSQAPTKATAKHKSAIRKFRRALRAEVPAGTIAHFKGSTSSGAGTDPWTIEGWVEFGGGDRYRYVQTPPRSEGAPGERQIVWGRGDYWAVTDVMRTSRGLREATNVGYTDPAVAFDSFVLGLRYADDAEARFGTAAPGPVVGGTPTRAVPVALPFPAAIGTQEITLLLNASTRTPVRLSHRLALEDGTVVDDTATDFSLWERVPTSVGAGALADEVPLTATIQSTP